MKININSLKNFSQAGSLYQAVLGFLIRQGHWLLLFFILLLLGYCGYLWKFYIDSYSWSEQRKVEYRESKGNGISFDEKKFNEIISEVDSRKTEYGKIIENATDIFRIK